MIFQTPHRQTGYIANQTSERAKRGFFTFALWDDAIGQSRRSDNTDLVVAASGFSGRASRCPVLPECGRLTADVAGRMGFPDEGEGPEGTKPLAGALPMPLRRRSEGAGSRMAFMEEDGEAGTGRRVVVARRCGGHLPADGDGAAEGACGLEKAAMSGEGGDVSGCDCHGGEVKTGCSDDRGDDGCLEMRHGGAEVGYPDAVDRRCRVWWQVGL